MKHDGMHQHWLWTYIQTYIHTRIHKCIHTYTHTYIHTYIHTHYATYIHTYIHTYIYIRACMHTCIHTYMHTYVHPCGNDEQHCMRRGVNLHDTDFESVPLFSPGYGPHFRVLPACIVQQVSSSLQDDFRMAWNSSLSPFSHPSHMHSATGVKMAPR